MRITGRREVITQSDIDESIRDSVIEQMWSPESGP
jgi:hypothetical protein